MVAIKEVFDKSNLSAIDCYWLVKARSGALNVDPAQAVRAARSESQAALGRSASSRPTSAPPVTKRAADVLKWRKEHPEPFPIASIVCFHIFSS